jgi:hypothetical protein
MAYQRVNPMPTLAELEARGYESLSTPERQRMRMLMAEWFRAAEWREDASFFNREAVERIEASRHAWRAARAATNPAEAARRKADALVAVEAVKRAKATQPVHARMIDAEIRGLADRRAAFVGERIDGLAVALTTGAMIGWLNDLVQSLDARPDAFALGGDLPEDEQIRQALARARCPVWWRRQLRRRVVILREDEGRRRGEICARKQLYVTDDTLRRRMEQNARNAAMLEATEMEAEDGELLRLAVAAGASTSNRAIRRGELMTRIRGCEEWAESHGMAGLFTTNTAPSRFHPMRHHEYGGGSNPNADGTYGPMQPNRPKDAQIWLCKVWQRTRARLAELGVPFFGFRVAEPHHDGCPHWHMLLWTSPEHVDKLRTVIRAQWLKDHPDEPGAKEHRFKAVTMERGGAAGYIAKYIAKNIDDAAMPIEGVVDPEAQGDMFAGNAAKRVEAWAAANGIRQFQPLGQPPVTVWRELRRIEADRIGGATPAVRKAHEAATRGLARRADWCAYMGAQGGAMTGRDYRVRMLTEPTETVGRYGTTTQDKPLGVIDAAAPDTWILSSRREWRPKGAWSEPAEVRTAPALGVRAWGLSARVNSRLPADATAKRAVHPWTRVNNCTDGGGVAELMRSGLVGLTLRNLEPGGSQTTEEPPWTSSRPSNPPLTPPSRPSSTPFTRSASA